MAAVGHVEQPAPIVTGGPSIQGMVCADLAQMASPVARLVEADMRERERIGIARYGTPLQAHNGRDARWDAYEEFLDGAAYLRQDVEEAPSGPDAERIDALYKRALMIAFALREIMSRRDGGSDVAV